MSERAAGYPWKYALFIGTFYSAHGVFQGYISKYYEQAGVSGAQMMLLMASAPAVALLAQPAWGRIGDRLKLRNTGMTVMLAASAALSLLLLLSPAFAWLLVVSCLFAAFFTPINPMGDSIVLEALDRRRAPFGPVRIAGSVAFALTNLFVARLFEGRYHLVPWVTAAFLLLSYPASRLLPPLPGHQYGRPKVPLRRVLQLPYMKPLMALVVSLMLGMGYFYSYFTLYFTALPGGTAALAGLAYFISALSEIFFLLYADRLFVRFGTGRLMVVSAFALTLRFAILGLSDSVTAALLSQLLHGAGFVIITVTMARYISLVVPDELKAGGQMLLSVAGYGLARVFGVFCGGFISDLTGGPAGGFLAMAALCFATLCLSGLYFFRQPPINGQTVPAGRRKRA